jgi:hypothetical protein
MREQEVFVRLGATFKVPSNLTYAEIVEVITQKIKDNDFVIGGECYVPEDQYISEAIDDEDNVIVFDY